MQRGGSNQTDHNQNCISCYGVRLLGNVLPLVIGRTSGALTVILPEERDLQAILRTLSVATRSGRATAHVGGAPPEPERPRSHSLPREPFRNSALGRINCFAAVSVRQAPLASAETSFSEPKSHAAGYGFLIVTVADLGRSSREQVDTARQPISDTARDPTPASLIKRSS